MKKTILAFIIIISSFMLKAGAVVVEEPVNKTDTTKQTGSKFSVGFMLDYTLLNLLDEKGLKGVFDDNGFNINILINVKYNLTKNINLISQFGYNYELYSFEKGDTNTTFPTAVSTNYSERFLLHAISLGIGARINLNKKVYTEFGVMSKFNFSKTYNYEAKNSNGNPIEVYVRDLNYIKDFNHDAYFRLGYNYVNLFAYYRLNDMFKPSNYAPVVYELPRLRIGISYGF
ncbi:MAG: hypothetical protein ACEQSR_09275 [Candidatus Methylacidiphilales bacterium]